MESSSGPRRRRETTSKTAQRIPKRLQQIRKTPNNGNADTPICFLEPYSTGPSGVYINAYFTDHPKITNSAVLSPQTFDHDTDSDFRRLQYLIQRVLAEAKSRGSKKVIVDLQSNGGGRVFLGYDAFLQAGHSSTISSQFFPNIEPFRGSRFRGHESANIFGMELSNLSFSPPQINPSPPGPTCTPAHPLPSLLPSHKREHPQQPTAKPSP